MHRIGFNLLFFGLGSKKALLEEFCGTLEDGQVVVANGFLNGTTVKKIIMSLSRAIFGSESGNLRSLSCEDIIESIKTSPKKLYLLLHNIDGPRMRNDEEQSTLAKVAACPNVSLVASVDHANSMMLWDMEHLSVFNWSMHEVTTYAPYTEETWDHPLIIAGRKQESERRGAAVVLRTLTQNAREVFMLIARYQLEDGDGGLSHAQLFRMCREQFLCSNETTLKAHMAEFRDHHLVYLKKGPDGDCYVVAMEKGEIEEIMKQTEREGFA